MSLQNIINRLDKAKKTGHLSYKALCPCHAEKTPSLSISEIDNKVIAFCFGCGATGVDVVAALGLDIDELFNEKRTMKNQKSEIDLEREQNAAFLDEVKNTTQALNGNETVTTYLKSRGIKTIPKTLRLLPAYKQNGAFYQCMIARIDDNSGNRISYHITHLTDDGKKANVETVKKILPCERDMAGASIKLFPHNGLLAVCEGIETALAVHDKTKIPAWSLINAGNMKTWQCPKDVKELHIIADMDSSFTGQASAYTLAQRSAALIGKEGYQLQNVYVCLLIQREADFELITDGGKKYDYLDYTNQQLEE